MQLTEDEAMRYMFSITDRSGKHVCMALIHEYRADGGTLYPQPHEVISKYPISLNRYEQIRERFNWDRCKMMNYLLGLSNKKWEQLHLEDLLYG